MTLSQRLEESKGRLGIFRQRESASWRVRSARSKANLLCLLPRRPPLASRWMLISRRRRAVISSLPLSPFFLVVPLSQISSRSLIHIPVGRDPPEASGREVTKGSFRFRSWIRQSLWYDLSSAFSSLPQPSSFMQILVGFSSISCRHAAIRGRKSSGSRGYFSLDLVYQCFDRFN